MIEGASIVCFAHDWVGDPTSKTHIMRLLSRRNRVLWVNSLGVRPPVATARDVRRVIDKLAAATRRSREVEPNLFVMSPIALPWPGHPAVDAFNAALLGFWLRATTRRHGLDRPILWTFLPTVGRLVGRLGERMVVYHCVDDHSQFSGVRRESLQRLERDLVRRSDIVFASSEQLCRERKPLNENTHFVSHGVDVEHFARALDEAIPIPDDLRSLPRPVIGFFGLIADWVDLDAVAAIARARPRWSIALIGKVVTGVERLRGLANVHLLGQKPYGDLPTYCRGFDAAIIPFRMNELTVRANPLKLREYLAAGLPVVASPMPEIARYGNLVRLAADPETYVRELEAALGDRSDAARRRRVDSMRGESWEARTAELSAIIAAHPKFAA